MRLGLAFLATSLGAGLSSCSDPEIVTAQVKLRQAPTTESEVLATIPRGGAIKVRNCTNGWCRISWNGRDGYILAKNVWIGPSLSRAMETDNPGEGDSQDDDTVAAPDSSVAAPM